MKPFTDVKKNKNNHFEFSVHVEDWKQMTENRLIQKNWSIMIVKHLMYRESNTPSWSYLPTPPLGQDMTQGQFLNGV